MEHKDVYPIKLFSWFDVKIKFGLMQEEMRKKGLLQADVYPYEIELLLSKESNEKDIYDYLMKSFSGRFDEKEKCIRLDTLKGKEKNIPIEFVIADSQSEIQTKAKRAIPSFKNMGTVPFKAENIPPPFDFPPIVVFYSYKGGVGRTLHIVDLLKVLTENGEKALIVDADLEAPGLTWWAIKDNVEPEISYIDFLSLLHADETDNFSETIDLIANYLEQTPWQMMSGSKRIEHYFLPTFRKEIQSILTPIKPEHILQSPGYEWSLLTAFHSLGKKLGVSVILIDLRAGISELSSPYLFDPRVIKCMVTSTSSQSMEGTGFVTKSLVNTYISLNRIITDGNGREKPGYYIKPFYILSMIPQDFHREPILMDGLRKDIYSMLTSFAEQENEQNEDNVTTEEVIETLFNANLTHLDGITDAFNKLPPDMDKSMLNFYENVINPKRIKTDSDKDSKITYSKKQASLHKLSQETEKLIYAEKGIITDIMPIPALTKIAKKYKNDLPSLVVIGSKGSGKTFVFCNLCYQKNWNAFVDSMNEGSIETEDKETPIFYPLLGSSFLQEDAKKHIKELQSKLSEFIPRDNILSFEQTRDIILNEIEKQQGIVAWKNIWLSIFAKALGIQYSNYSSFKSQDMPKRKVIFLIDGLEDTLQKVHSDENQQLALRALLQSIPEVLREDPAPPWGLIVFIRRDMAFSSIKQNFNQFESLYQAYTLKWDQTSALRLVVWVIKRIAQLEEWLDQENTSEDIFVLSKQQLETMLVKLWGWKLGSDNSREANTTNWILGALSNFNGELQARDMVRFIHYAAEIAASKLAEAKSSSAYKDRLLSPDAIRSAIKPCSNKKIEEIRIEITTLNDFFEIISAKKDSEKTIPFNPYDFVLKSSTVSLLEELGMIKRGTQQDEGYFMPEIYRLGLGFWYKKGARPRVLALQRSTLP